MIYPKGKSVQLSEHFQSLEFDCHCPTCCETVIDPELVLKLEKLRTHLGVPITITSAYRCSFYQRYLKERGYETAKGISTHEQGRAVDLTTHSHTGEELNTAARSVGFLAVGVGKDWVHIDLRADKPRRWEYSY